jgi:hypothetical protein
MDDMSLILILVSKRPFACCVAASLIEQGDLDGFSYWRVNTDIER